MKRIIYFLVFFLFWGWWSLSEAVVDRVVAIVNQEIITLSDVEKWKGPVLAETQPKDRLEKQEQTQQALRAILDRLVEEKLIDQEVKKSGLKVSTKEVEGAIEDIKRKNGLSQEDFERALGREGLNIESLKKQIEKQMLRARLVSLSVKVEPKVEEKELRDFYQKNLDRYRGTETYRASHILFYVPKEATPEEVHEIRKKCQRVLDKIKKGEDFKEMAILYSEDPSAKDGGDLGYFKKGELIPIFEKEARRLKVGEVSGIVRSEFGFHIIKLLDRKGVEPPPFEELKDRVRAEYLDKETDKAVRQFLSNLRAKSAIEIKL